MAVTITKKILASIAGIGTIFAAYGGFIAAEDRYNQAPAVKMSEQKTSQTLDQVQQSIIDMRGDFKLESITTQLYNADCIVKSLRRELERYPNDRYIQEDYDNAIEYKKRIETKLFKLSEEK